MNSQQTIDELKRGNQALLNKVYIKYRNQFIAYSLRRYPIDFETLKEIYQDVILALYTNIHEGKLVHMTSSLKSYLFEIGKHMIFKNLRSKNFDLEYTDTYQDKFDRYAQSVKPTIEEEDVITVYLKNELEKLSEKCYLLLKLFYFERKKMEDIAHLMNFSSIDSAKTQKYKCFEKLRESVRTTYPRFINA